MLEFALKRVALTAAAAAALTAGAASAQEACTNYTVTDGDTLATISIAAYGTSNYQPIFNANRNIISNPTDLKPGLVLALPCEDGSLPNGQSAQELIAAEEARNANNRVSNVYEPPIKIVTGGNYANETVAPSVRSNLTAVMGRIAGYRGGEVSWDEMIKSAEKLELDLSGLKA